MPDKHATLSPSSASRWGACPPSALLEQQFPNASSSFTEEGTRAHAFCERLLRINLLHEDDYPLPWKPDDEEMSRCVQDYADFVEEEFNAAKAETPDAQLFVEQELDLSAYVPEGFGTSDAVIISDSTLEVIDFKYGRGVRVDAENNPQLRLYALGAYLKFSALYDFTQVKTVVFQPRLSHIDGESLSTEELISWAENYIKPRAKLAFEGKGEFCVGDHCRFCRAGAVCRARAQMAFEVIDASDKSPVLLDDDEIAPILDKLDNAEKWIASVRAYAQEKAVAGKKWPGYKLVEGRTIRKITNQIEAALALCDAGFSQEDITNTKLKGITELEKIVGKARFNELVGQYVVKPHGEPTLVKETDKRTEINPLEDMFKEE